MAESKALDESLYGEHGNRLFLDSEERRAFRRAAMFNRYGRHTFSILLNDTGCTLSEGLKCQYSDIDFEKKFVRFKNRDGSTRSVPLSDDTLRELSHGLDKSKTPESKIWPMDRTTAWRQVSDVLNVANISAGPRATPRGIRHGFGVHAVSEGVPVSLLKIWMGHKKIESTAIYLAAVDYDERELARRMWRSLGIEDS